ncbi:MAG: alpha/beta hydrolase [Pseudomonadota bacterium]
MAQPTIAAYGAHARQTLEIHRPPAGERPHHVFVFYHGGGWRSGSPRLYRFLGRALAKAGILTVMPGYRLFPEARFPAFIEDSALALAWVTDHIAAYGGQSDRLVIGGHSAGAHIAAHLAVDPAWLAPYERTPAAVAGLLGMSGPYALNLAKYGRIGEAFKSAERPEAVRPDKRVLETGIAPPTLLLHGARDPVVGMFNAIKFEAVLGSLGVPVACRLYGGAGHMLPVLACHGSVPTRLKSRMPVFEDMVRFIAQDGETRWPAKRTEAA